MNKATLVEKVSEMVGTTKIQAESTVDAVFNTITASVKTGDDVAIAGFGKFSLKNTKAREARNPKTGATVHVAASKKPKFTAAKAFKELVKN